MREMDECGDDVKEETMYINRLTHYTQLVRVQSVERNEQSSGKLRGRTISLPLPPVFLYVRVDKRRNKKGQVGEEKAKLRDKIRNESRMDRKDGCEREK